MAIPRKWLPCPLAIGLLCTACTSFGPRSIPQDRQGYSSAIGDSWKEQTLLNIVRLRYADAPVFLDVSSVVASYSAESQLDASIAFPAQGASSSGLGGYGRYINKPTISYAPLTGEKFTQSLLRPIPPVAVFQMIQAGYPADFILGATTRAMNGRYNRSAGANPRQADPEFLQLADALRRIQRSEALGMRIEQREKGEATLLFFRDDASAAVEADVERVRLLLKVRPSPEFSLVYGPVQRSDKEIALLTRSMLEILMDFSNHIDVPAEHVANGRTYTGYTRDSDGSRRLATIHSGTRAPTDAYAAVPYRGTWYWIDDHDMDSKRAFAFMMMFFSLAESGPTAPPPLLTIGTN